MVSAERSKGEKLKGSGAGGFRYKGDGGSV